MTVKFNWYSKDEVPAMDYPLLVMTENKKLMTFKDSKGFYNGDMTNCFSDWKNMVRKYKIKYWIYQKALVDNDNWIGYFDE